MKRTAWMVVLLLFCAAAPAHAEGFVEMVGGVMLPLDDTDWEDLVEESPKLGFRAGVGPAGDKLRLAFEVGLDYSYLLTDFGEEAGESWDVTAHRLRGLAGARVAYVTHGAALFARAGAGVDYVSASWSYDVPVVGTVEDEDDDVALALEVGAGVIVPVGPVGIGAQFALPMSFHEDEGGEDTIVLDYQATDLDVLLTVSSRW